MVAFLCVSIKDEGNIWKHVAELHIYFPEVLKAFICTSNK